MASPEAVENLAKAYLYAGFGAEARLVLASFDVRVKDGALLEALAEIMDDGWAFERAVLENQTDCDSPAALWGSLSIPSFEPGLAINRGAVKRAFSELPVHLRRQLGPSLSRRFLEAGDESTAIDLKNAISRAAGNPGPEFQRLEAQIQRQKGHANEAESTLQKVVSADGPSAPQALVDLLEAKLEDGSGITPEMIDSVQAQAFENQGTAIGDKLEELSILALSKTGKYQAALAGIKEGVRSHRLSPEHLASILTQVLSDATASADDQDFLILVYQTREMLKDTEIRRPQRRDAAERLVDLGFVEMAGTVLAAPPRPSPEDRIILARAALKSGNPGGALDLLNGLPDGSERELRSQAFEKLGRLDMAAKEYEAAGDQSGLRSIHWREKDWPKVEETGTDSQKMVAAIARQQASGLPEETVTPDGGPVGDPKQGILVRDRSLLDASQADRRSVSALLKAFPPPDGGG